MTVGGTKILLFCFVFSLVSFVTKADRNVFSLSQIRKMLFPMVLILATLQISLVAAYYGWNKMYFRFPRNDGFHFDSGFVIIIALAIIHDLHFTLCHRLLHVRSFFREHRLHHTGGTSPWTSFTFGAGDIFFTYSFYIAAPFFIQVSLAQWSTYLDIVMLWNIFVHTRFPMSMNRFFCEISMRFKIVTPWSHQRHHSKSSSDFGLYTEVWNGLLDLCIGIFRKNRQFFPGVGLSIISGILFASSFVPYFPWAITFCYVPLWIYLYRRRAGVFESLFCALVTQLAGGCIAASWVSSSVRMLFNFNEFQGAISVLFFVFINNLHLTLAVLLVALLARKIRFSLLRYFLILATAHSLADIFWPKIFEWNLAAALLPDQFQVLQFARYIGTHGLSWLLLLCNGGIAAGWIWLSEQRQYSLRKMVPRVAIPVFTFVLTICPIPGAGLSSSEKLIDAPVRILAIGSSQRKIKDRLRSHDMTAKVDALEDLFSITRNAIKESGKVDLIVWPESAVSAPFDPRYSGHPLSAKVYEFVRQTQIPLLTGGRSYIPDAKTPGAFDSQNAVFLIDKNGKTVWSHIKSELVPLVESAGNGLGDVFLRRFQTSDPGAVFQIGSLRVGSQVCYEGNVSSFVLNQATAGVDLMINLSNDEYLAGTNGSEHHAMMTGIKAVEFGVPVLRVSNQGLSGLFKPDGTWEGQSSAQSPYYSVFEIASGHFQNSFYARNPHPLPWFEMIFLILLISLEFYRKTPRFAPISSTSTAPGSDRNPSPQDNVA